MCEVRSGSLVSACGNARSFGPRRSRLSFGFERFGDALADTFEFVEVR